MLSINYIIEFVKLYIMTAYIFRMKKEYSVKTLNIFIVPILLFTDIFRVMYTGHFIEYTYDTYICGVFAIIANLIVFKKMRDIFKIIGLYIIICFMDMLIAGVFITIFSLDAIIFIENYIYTMLVNLGGIFLLSGIAFLQRHINMNINMDYISWKEVLLIIICIIGGGFYLAPFQLFKNNFGRLFAMEANISGIIIVVVSILLILRSNNIRYLKKEQVMQEGIIVAQQEYYSKRLEQERNTRKFRHDINEHLSTMLYYINKNMYNEVKEYIQQLTNDLNDINVQSGINTGLDIVNIILSDLVSIYQGVEVRWTGIIPQDIRITNKDLIGLFSNLLKNAFEATTKCDTSYIDICTSYFDRHMYISVENSYNGKMQKKEGSFLTSKTNKKEHGFGTQIIEDIVLRYGGQIVYTNSDKKFKVEITFINIGN